MSPAALVSVVLHPSYSPRTLLGEGPAFAESLAAWDRRPGHVTRQRSLRGGGKATLHETSGSAVGGGGRAGAGGSRDRRRKRGRQAGVFKKLYENICLFITLFFCISEILAILWIYLIENKRKTMPITQR